MNELFDTSNYTNPTSPPGDWAIDCQPSVINEGIVGNLRPDVRLPSNQSAIPNSELRTPNSELMTQEYLTLSEIRRDGGTQPRAAIDLRHVKLLSEQMEEGKELEPVTVFYDGESYWLADGFHRWQAHHNRGEEVIACVIHQGNRRDAVLYSVGANSDHKPALPRSRNDKRRAVMTLLQDSEWSQWSDREIARQCKVHHNTVSKIRASLTGDLSSNTSSQSVTGDLSSEKRTYKTKHGTVASMNTANIGRKAPTPLDTKRVTITGDHPLFGGQSGTITAFPNPSAAIVELENGTRELIERKYLCASSGKAQAIANSELRTPNSEVMTEKVEVNTNDILIAFASNLDYLSTEQLKFVGKAIAHQSPERVEEVVRAIGISSEEQAVAIVKAMALVYPEAVHKLLEEGKDR